MADSKKKERVEIIKGWIDILGKCIFASGLTCVLAYLFFKVQFFPSGLTIADSFLFIYTIFGFGILYLAFTIFSWAAGQIFIATRKFFWEIVLKFVRALHRVAIYVSRRGKHRWFPYACVKAYRWLRRQNGIAYSITAIFYTGLYVLLVAALHPDASIADDLTSILSSVFLIGAISFGVAGVGLHLHLKRLDEEAGQILTRPRRRQRARVQLPSERLRKNLRNYAYIFFPIFFGYIFLVQWMIPFTMEHLGIRKMNTTVVLSEENYRLLEVAMRAQNMIGLGCPLVGSPNQKIVYGVNLLWTGIGERSLVEIPASLRHDYPLVLPLQRDGIHEIEYYRGPIERCMEMNEDVYFPKGSKIPLPQSTPELITLANEIKYSTNDIEEVRVIGHADPMPFPGHPEKNMELAVDRACSVGEYLVKNANGLKYRIAVESRGASEPKTLCKDWPVKESIGECLAANRRVELRVKYKEDAATGSPEGYKEERAPPITLWDVYEQPAWRKSGRFVALPKVDLHDDYKTVCQPKK